MCNDFCVGYFCMPCAACQLKRDIEIRKSTGEFWGNFLKRNKSGEHNCSVFKRQQRKMLSSSLSTAHYHIVLNYWELIKLYDFESMKVQAVAGIRRHVTQNGNCSMVCLHFIRLCHVGCGVKLWVTVS